MSVHSTSTYLDTALLGTLEDILQLFYGPDEIGTNGQQSDDELHPRSPFSGLGHQFDGNYSEKIT